MSSIQVIGHRGAAKSAPENTMAAFKQAIEMGANAIETDVQMTKDGRLILIHDETLNRTTNGKGLVKNYSLEELKKLDAGGWFSPAYKGQRIPTIEELFQLIGPTNLWLNVEIKDGFILYPGIEEKLVETINQFKMQNRVIISSFNHYSIVLTKKLEPSIETAVLYSEGLYEPWEYAKKLGANFLHPAKDAVHPTIVQEAHRNEIKVHPYTVDDIDEMKALIKMNVDGIITNQPNKLVELLKK